MGQLPVCLDACTSNSYCLAWAGTCCSREAFNRHMARRDTDLAHLQLREADLRPAWRALLRARRPAAASSAEGRMAQCPPPGRTSCLRSYSPVQLHDFKLAMAASGLILLRMEGRCGGRELEQANALLLCMLRARVFRLVSSLLPAGQVVSQRLQEHFAGVLCASCMCAALRTGPDRWRFSDSQGALPNSMTRQLQRRGSAMQMALPQLLGTIFPGFAAA